MIPNVDSEFKSLIPPFSPEEFQQLECFGCKTIMPASQKRHGGFEYRRNIEMPSYSIVARMEVFAGVQPTGFVCDECIKIGLQKLRDRLNEILGEGC